MKRSKNIRIIAADSAFDVKRFYVQCKEKKFSLESLLQIQDEKKKFTNLVFRIGGSLNKLLEYYLGFVESKYVGQKLSNPL